MQTESAVIFCFSSFASSLLRYEKFFKLASKKFSFPKYKKNLFQKIQKSSVSRNVRNFFRAGLFLVFGLGKFFLKSCVSQNIRKVFFKKILYKNFFNLRARTFYFPKQNKFFNLGTRKFHFLKYKFCRGGFFLFFRDWA